MLLIIEKYMTAQGSKGIKKMADKLVYIPNYGTQNYLVYKLQLLDKTYGHSTNQYSKIVSKVVEPTNKKTL